jgi:hypothetical protein
MCKCTGCENDEFEHHDDEFDGEDSEDEDV